jgi:hypothetical protein
LRCKKTAPAVAAEPITVQQTTTRQSKLKKLWLTRLRYSKEVPILCYHNIKDFADQAGEMTKTYTVKPLSFAAQMKPFTTLVTTVST